MSCVNYRVVLKLAVIICICSLNFFAQKPTGPNFDVQDFNKKFETVQWLVEYDEIAWKTSDVVITEDKTEIARLGTEWFCLQDSKKMWHTLYGKLENGKFSVVFHYAIDSAGKINSSNYKFDQSLLDSYAKALVTARAKLKTSIPANSPAFNQYIRRESNGTFGVWMLPAFQRDETAVYGGEAFYAIDSVGNKILNEESYFQPNFRGFKTQPPRDIWLNYSELEKPTLGAIFFVWYYKTYFTNITIDNTHSTSTVVNTGKDGYIWVHVEKNAAKTTKVPEG